MRILEPKQNLRSIVTRRTLLPPPAARESAAWTDAWDHLCHTYTPALTRFVQGYLRRIGYQAADRDMPAVIVQEFLTKNMASGQLAKDGAEVRQFRAWISTHLRRFVHDWLDRELAAKRRPPGSESPEVLEGVGSLEQDPALHSFDKGFVTIALGNALARLRRGEGAPKWGGVYADIVQDLSLTHGEGSADLHERLGVRRDQMPILRNRARKKLSQLFVGELRTTVQDDEALAELLRDLDPLLP